MSFVIYLTSGSLIRALMKPMIKDEKILNEGLEKASENQDNTNRISCFAWGNYELSSLG